MDVMLKYNMNEAETLAYKIGLDWLRQSVQLFPNYHHAKGFPVKGDPRKNYLFKICYKLQRETRGIVEDYSQYIRAQLDIMRAIKIGEHHPQIGASILVGDKAWIRWKVWKKKFKSIVENSTLEDVGLDKTDEDKVIVELIQTKKYLEGKYGKPYHEHQIMMAKSEMERWVALEKVSPFYALLSPWARKHCNFKNVFDEDLYKSSVTKRIEEKFKEMFANELQNDAIPLGTGLAS